MIILVIDKDLSENINNESLVIKVSIKFNVPMELKFLSGQLVDYK